MASEVVTNAIVPVAPPPNAIVQVVAPKSLTTTDVSLSPVKVTEQQAMVMPAPSLNIIFEQKGGILTGTGHIINGGKIEAFQASINLLELRKLLVPGSKVGSIFDDIGSAITSIAKSTIVKQIVSVTKSVVKSKELGAAIGGLAVVFPPVGLPAAGAYAAANVALKYIENGKKGIDRAQALIKSGKPLSPKDKANLKTLIARKERAQDKLRIIAAKAKAPPNPKLRLIQAAAHKKNRELKAAKSDQRVIPPVSPREYAQIIGHVIKSRAKIENIRRGLAVPLSVNLHPRIIKTPIGKNDPIIVFWRDFLKSHPIKTVRQSFPHTSPPILRPTGT